MILNIHALTAVALAGVDLAANERNNISSEPRVITGVGVTGSVAINDFWVDVFIGRFFVGRFYNTKPAGTQIQFNEDIRPTGRLLVKPSSKISVICGANAGAGDVDVLVV